MAATAHPRSASQSLIVLLDQDAISGLSRSVSNLGSSLGTALAGSVLASALVPGNKSFACPW